MKRQAAAAAPDCTPSAALTADDDSQGFTSFERRSSSELSTMRNQASHEGDGRFYYTGMAQAFLLDRLMPGWKRQLMDEGECLENLLRKAVNRNEFAGAQGNAIGQSASQPALDEIDLFVEAQMRAHRAGAERIAAQATERLRCPLRRASGAFGGAGNPCMRVLQDLALPLAPSPEVAAPTAYHDNSR